MPIYEAGREYLTAVPTTSFVAVGWKERGDLQRLLAERIEALEAGLLVLAEEFADWADSARRIDLLCLDVKARLVVVELKRDEDGGHMELQALRHAAMVSAMTFSQAVTTFARFRKLDESAARKAILAHLRWATSEENAFAQETRVILAAADFGKEITTTVLWLRNRYRLDITCVRLRPHQMSDGRMLLDIQTLIPLPEAEDFWTKIGVKKAAEQEERSEREALLSRFLDQLNTRAALQTDLYRGRTPNVGVGVLSGSIGRTGFSLNQVVASDRSRVGLLIVSETGREQLFRLKQAQATIEESFGSPLQWQEKEGVRQCRISYPVEGGYRSPETDWPAIQQNLVSAAIKLDAALRPPAGETCRSAHGRTDL